MEKGLHNNQHVFMSKNIPYRFCFEEAGMIETEEGVYSRTYEILPPEGKVKGRYSAKMARMLMKDILQKLSEHFSFEFTIRNCRIEREAYLSKVTIREKDDAYRHLRRMYNRVLQDCSEIGHNNYVRKVYLTLSTEAAVPERALEEFKKADQWLSDSFHSLYGFGVKALELSERLELLYDIYHPDPDAPGFGNKVDYNGNGFSVKSMQRMKMDTKDTIAPERYDYKERDYMRVGSCYVRSFYVSSIPESVPDSILLDLVSVSSNSILSTHYERLDQELGFQVVSKRIKDNTEVSSIPVRTTIEDRKAHRMQRQEKWIRDNEEEYFYQSAFHVMKQAKAKCQGAIHASFIITLFANSLEELDRDSALLRLSASKYACQIRCLDLQQNEGFQSVLPLNNLKVHVGLIFPLEQMAVMHPLAIHEIFEKVRTFYGLNAINDNCVFMDRTNFSTGMIAGRRYTGKTTAVKREAVNTLISTDDDVIILAEHPREYQALVETLDGHVIQKFCPDIFDKDENYNLNEDKGILQKQFLEAYLIAKVVLNEQWLQKDMIQEYSRQAEEEATVLSRFSSLNEALLYAKEHPVEMKLFVKSMEQFSFHFDHLNDARRLTVLGYENEVELLVLFDYLWNYAVQRKKKNHTVWIFVDSADSLIFSTAKSRFLNCVLERAEVLKIPITLVIQDAVHIVTTQSADIEFDYLLNNIRYFKLLSLGPIERKKFVERLNISGQLVPYFVDRGPGEGILVTPSANIAVNDWFEQENQEFYRLFC